MTTSKRMILALLIVLAAGVAQATTYYVDSTTGDNGDSGTTMDAAWATLEKAVESASMATGDTVWVRRIHAEYSGAPTSDIANNKSGTAASPIRYIGWPRASQAIASSDWTNGSTGVVIDDGGMDREKHLGRYIAGPDSETYLITKITDENNIVIDREYAGSTASNDATAVIAADEDYTEAQAINDSGWTINKAAWNADAADLPVVDFQDAAYRLVFNSDRFVYFKNLEIRDTTVSAGLLGNDSVGYQVFFVGCLFHQSNDKAVVSATRAINFDRCIFTGSGSGSSQKLTADAECLIINSAIYSMGSNCINVPSNQIGNSVYLRNVNVGVEGNCGAADLYISGTADSLKLESVKFGAAVGEVAWAYLPTQSRLQIDNYNKILGAHKTFTPQGNYTKVAAGGGGDLPNQRSGGNASLISVDLNVSTSDGFAFPKKWMRPVFVAEFEATTASKSYRIYIQNVGAIAAGDLVLKCEYVSSYDDTSEYVITEADGTYAHTPMPARANADDWGEYIECASIAPAVASKVRLELYSNYYHATDEFYVDPLVYVY